MLPMLFALFVVFTQPTMDRLYDRLSEASQQSIERLGAGFEARVPPKLQIRLLRQDLEWQQRGYSARQMRLISALALYKAAATAEQELEDLMAINEPSDKDRARISELTNFIVVAVPFVEDEAEALEDMKEYELMFTVR